jgi:hypothetical protein
MNTQNPLNHWTNMKFTTAPCRILCAFLLVLQSVTASFAEGQQAATSATFALQDGTPIKLRLSQTVSSADAQVNDRVEFEVLEDVMVDNVVVIAKGATALGTVTEAVPKRRMGRAGKLEIVMDSVRLVDGQKAALRAVKDAKGGSHTAGMTIGIVAAAVVFWPAAPLFLLMHGKDITIPKGTDVPTFVNGDMKLEPARFQAAAGGATQPTGTGASNVTVGSTPVGAEIYLDQNFVGNTPSTINVPSGKHSVCVRKPGYQDWVRDMNFSGGAITLSAELVAGSNRPSSTASPTVQSGDLTPSEMSVAEAARLNKAAKTRDNQPPQQ